MKKLLAGLVLLGLMMTSGSAMAWGRHGRVGRWGGGYYGGYRGPVVRYNVPRPYYYAPAPVYAPAPRVWIAPQWVWNGYQWQWRQGYWSGYGY